MERGGGPPPSRVGGWGARARAPLCGTFPSPPATESEIACFLTSLSECACFLTGAKEGPEVHVLFGMGLARVLFDVAARDGPNAAEIRRQFPGAPGRRAEAGGGWGGVG